MAQKREQKRQKEVGASFELSVCALASRRRGMVEIRQHLTTLRIGHALLKDRTQVSSCNRWEAQKVQVQMSDLVICKKCNTVLFS
jgi:hypothetical protein